MSIISSYQNGETLVTIMADGTKIRDISNGTRADYPESIDVKITNWCDAGCHWCHEQSTPKGNHGDLVKLVPILSQLPRGAEIAIGGGHPLAHPGVEVFLESMAEAGVICNVTINEKHFYDEIDRIEKLIDRGLLYGVGYSYSSRPCEWKYEHLVTHVIVGITPYDHLQRIVSVNPKVLLLGYKFNTGRGVIFNEKNHSFIESNIASWYRNLFFAAKEAHLSFDNLAIKQLNPKRLFTNSSDYDTMFMGEDGLYSMYIDAVEEKFSVASTGVQRFDYMMSMKEMFSHVK